MPLIPQKQIAGLLTSLSTKIDGTGTASQVTFYLDADTITSSSNLTYDGSQLSLNGSFLVDTTGLTYSLYIDDSTGYIGINNPNPAYNLEVNGSFAATDKSFLIDHPTKEGMKLRHGSLEGPEHGVYVRGRLKGENIINLPDYWVKLVDLDTVTVQLTPVGDINCYIEDMDLDNLQIQVNVSGGGLADCFYLVQAERKDIDKMTFEY